MSVHQNLNFIKEQLPPTCKLIAVTKTHPAAVVMEAYDAGHKIFGENKVQELTTKYDALPKDIEWHLIGHLQSNKVKYVAPFVSLIHAVDSVKLAQEINRQGQKVNRVLSCLLQIHIAKEDTKFGFSEEELLSTLKARQFDNLPFVKIVGLMGMASFTDNQNQVRDEFRSLRLLFQKIKAMPLPDNMVMEELSMGMSGDYKIAIEEGSSMVRVGSAIFGNRDYSK